MLSEEDFVEINKFKVEPGKVISLKNYPTDYEGKTLDKSQAEELLEAGRQHLAEVQEKLYAQNQFSVLIILQAMDASGKDSAVKHIMSAQFRRLSLADSARLATAFSLHALTKKSDDVDAVTSIQSFASQVHVQSKL